MVAGSGWGVYFSEQLCEFHYDGDQFGMTAVQFAPAALPQPPVPTCYMVGCCPQHFMARQDWQNLPGWLCVFVLVCALHIRHIQHNQWLHCVQNAAIVFGDGSYQGTVSSAETQNNI